MRLVQPIPEAAMVAHFLRTELYSGRLGIQTRRGLAGERLGSEILEYPDLSHTAETLCRAILMG